MHAVRGASACRRARSRDKASRGKASGQPNASSISSCCSTACTFDEPDDGADIARELYLGMLIDRETSRVTLMASSEGGMEIEEVAASTPRSFPSWGPSSRCSIYVPSSSKAISERLSTTDTK